MDGIGHILDAPSSPLSGLAIDDDEQPWSAEEPVAAASDGALGFSGAGGARVDLPVELVGGAVLITLVTGDDVGVYFPDVEDGPDSWPAFGGLLFSGSDLFGTLGTPVFSTTLWITASEPWSIAIQPLPILEGTTATGTGTTWIAVIEPIGEGTVVAPDGVFGVDVIGVDGYGDRLLYDGETRKRFTWSPSPIAVIGLRILDGIAWRLELGPADGSEG